MAKSKANVTANNEAQPMAVLEITAETLSSNLTANFEKLGATFEPGILESFVKSLVSSQWAKDTKNGALKLTDTKPTNDANVKGTKKIGDFATFYFVPMSKGDTISLMSLRSYTFPSWKYENLKRAMSKVKTFEDWSKNEGKTYFNNLGASGDVAKLFQEGKTYDDIMRIGFAEYKKDFEKFESLNFNEE